MKGQIDNYINVCDLYKKYSNTYEYIHTTIPFSKLSVCKLKPLSRSFYKLIEILNTLNIDFQMNQLQHFIWQKAPEAIEALITQREYNNKNYQNDIYYGMTLIDEDENVPSWKKSKHFLSKHQNIKLVYGEDNTGNLLNVDNLWYCYNNYKNSVDFITGDGGFDFSVNFNEQEDYL